MPKLKKISLLVDFKVTLGVHLLHINTRQLYSPRKPSICWGGVRFVVVINPVIYLKSFRAKWEIAILRIQPFDCDTQEYGVPNALEFRLLGLSSQCLCLYGPCPSPNPNG